MVTVHEAPARWTSGEPLARGAGRGRVAVGLLAVAAAAVLSMAVAGGSHVPLPSVPPAAATHNAPAAPAPPPSGPAGDGALRDLLVVRP